MNVISNCASPLDSARGDSLYPLEVTVYVKLEVTLIVSSSISKYDLVKSFKKPSVAFENHLVLLKIHLLIKSSGFASRLRSR